MERAIPNTEKIRELKERKSFLESELSKNEVKKDRLIESIADGIISKVEATIKIREIRQAESELKADIDLIAPQLQDVPTEKQIASKAKLIQRQLQDFFDSPGRLARMTFEEKRSLAGTFFAGKDSEGKRLGVYVEKTNNGFRYEIRGIFGPPLQGTLTPDGPNVEDSRDKDVEYMEDLLEVTKFASP